MGLRKLVFASGENYHVYNRGNGKQAIFHDKEDYTRFISLLHACNQEGGFKSDNLNKGQSPLSAEIDKRIVFIGSYCLMPNHFHILITQQNEKNISVFMKKLLTAYVMYYNKKYNRTGSLFEGKFKAEHVNTDNYLKYLFAYIHLNPVSLIDKGWKKNGLKDKTKTTDFILDYPYSSFQDFAGVKRAQNKILDTSMFPQYFSSHKEFKKDIFYWFNIYREESPSGRA